MKTAFITILILLSVYGHAQRFPVTGQLPTTAFPVCGTDTFRQATVPIGATHALQVPGCGNYNDVNPFWYQFTCYKAGTLGFLIRPNNLGDDYDWMLFDITGRKATDVFTNASLVVTGNWAGTYGLTGARAGGVGYIQCGSDPADKEPTFSNMPVLKLGHTYLLLISHYTDSQSGYSLTFGGGTAVINDPGIPSITRAFVGCNRALVTILLSKQVRCNSLAADGSDFKLNSGSAQVVAATGLGCDSHFDMDSLLISLSAPLAPGTYTMQAQTGSDGNTLLDDCGNTLESGTTVSFVVPPPHITPMDSLTTPACAPSILELVFSDPIQCSSIAADGSDFSVTGNTVTAVSFAKGSCVNGLTNIIDVFLSSPMVTGGNYQINLKTGSDGNAIINECGIATPAGASIPFTLKDTVTADFNYQIYYGCVYDSLQFFFNPANGVNQWEWMIDSVSNGNNQQPLILENVFGLKNVQHIVSNGFCSDTVSKIVNLDNLLDAVFLASSQVCPKDLVAFQDSSIGHIIAWSWDFGDGTSSNEADPPDHLFPNTATGKTYTVSLVVKDNLGCTDSLTRNVVKLQSCYITVPNAFTPNGDGKNDYLYPLNAFSTTNLEFMVFNRFGQMVFESRDWSQKWDGSIHGKLQGAGTYIWTLRYTDGNSGQHFFLRGTSVLIR